ncbi:MAG: carboxypeptidase regulatory-like domain-containing protein [Acidobacteria bacterium]|nr:carboxypeptidase regulatory-like domain-containing protein [Acidobacteriota bacterium]
MSKFCQIAFLLFVLCGGLLTGQSPTANVIGVIKDQTGAQVPGASVILRHVEKGETREISSNAEGEFTITNLSPGEYQILISKEGFRKLEERGVVLELDQTARIEFAMQVGSVTETMQVEATVPLLNTENAAKGDVIVSKEMVDIPLDGRDFADLAYLVPGVGQKAQGASGSNFNVNGARSDNTNFVIDGFNNQNPRGGSAQARPPLDAMMEFKMQTTGYSAEYGRLAGGTMNMVLKTGTNKLHGSLFEFIRNDAFDARGVFDSKKTKLRRNQFGAVLDGPVYIPKLYDGRNRMFFLVNWEAYRQINGNSNYASVPTEKQRGGDFNGSVNVNNQPVTLVDPFSGGKSGACVNGKIGDCFPGNVIPASRLDPIAKQVMAYYPLPTLPGNANNYYTVIDDNDKWDTILVKLDKRFRSADNLSGRFLKRFNRNTNPYNGSAVGGFGNATDNHQTLAGLSYTALVRPTLINETRLGVTRTANREIADKQGRDYAAEWGLQGSTSEPDMVGFPRFTVTNMAALGNAASMPVIYHVTNYQVADTLTWVKGKHMLKFGGDLMRTQFFQPYYNNNRGTYIFNGFWTTSPVADMTLGVLNQVTRTVGTNPNYLFFNNFGFFAQDDYRVSSTLTLNVGLRYEIPTPPNEKYGRMSNFVPELGKLVISSDRTVPNLPQLLADASLTGKVVLASEVGLPDSLIKAYYRSLAPRFGFAWRPFGRTQTVVRGGYGIYYGSNLWNPVRNDLANVYPFTIAQTLNKNTSNPSLLTLQNPLGVRGNLAGVLTPNGFQTYPTPQYLQSWNLTMERELNREIAMEVAYVGSKGTHLGRKFNINQPYRVPEMRVNGAFPRPISTFNDIDFYSFGSNSIYNAGIITLRKRTQRGIFYRINYVFSKSLDDSSQIADSSDGGIGQPQNSRCLRCERGRSDWDRGHSVTALFLYNLPSGGFAPLRRVQVSGTTRMQTGSPVTLLVSNSQLDQGEANRPDRIAKGTLENPTPEMWYDKAAFPLVPSSAFRFGTSGRNVIDGPGLVDVNISLIKRMQVRERAQLQFRGEAFNAINHPNFNLPNQNVNAPAGGTITAARNARLFQFSLRLQF